MQWMDGDFGTSLDKVLDKVQGSSIGTLQLIDDAFGTSLDNVLAKV